MCSPESKDHPNATNVFIEAIFFILLLFIGEMKALNGGISQNGSTVWKTAPFPVFLLLFLWKPLSMCHYTHTYNTKHTHIRSFPFHGKARWSSRAFFGLNTHTEDYFFLMDIMRPLAHYSNDVSVLGLFHLSDSDLPALCDLFSLHRGFLWLKLSKSLDLVHLVPRHRLTESHA